MEDVTDEPRISGSELVGALKDAAKSSLHHKFKLLLLPVIYPGHPPFCLCELTWQSTEIEVARQLNR
jgi:hypothetical protein